MASTVRSKRSGYRLSSLYEQSRTQTQKIVLPLFMVGYLASINRTEEILSSNAIPGLNDPETRFFGDSQLYLVDNSVTVVIFNSPSNSTLRYY